MASQLAHAHHHFLLVPLMSQSHLIPFTDMARALAHHGQHVTIVMTPLNASRFNPIIDYATDFNLKIQFVSFPFPGQEAGLPQGCENMDSLPSLSLATNFFEASNMLQGPLEQWLQDSESLPSCIISDICFPWTSALALKFNIQRVVLHTVSCFALLCSHNIKQVSNSSDSEFDHVLVPNIPDRIELTKAQLQAIAPKQSSEEIKNRLRQFKEAEFSASAVLLNSFEEMESGYVKEYQKLVNNLWCIGPLPLYNKSSKVNPSMNEHGCLTWLESKSPNSVIYVCFGSLSHMSTPQLIELGLGLESSNVPFIWTIKERDCSPELEKWFNEQRFEQRVGKRGLIIKGWAPQVLILSHQAIGGFFTHCGWNSTLEGVSSGLPMLTWPMFAEQFYNEKFIVQVLKIGVRIGVEAPAKDDEVLVKRDDVKKAVEEVVDGGEEGVERRKRAQQLGEMARRAVEEGGSSYLNVRLLIEHVKVKSTGN